MMESKEFKEITSGIKASLLERLLDRKSSAIYNYRNGLQPVPVEIERRVRELHAILTDFEKKWKA